MTGLERRPNQRFLTLDAMRGVAALAVLAHHFPDPTFARIFPGAYLAVDMFFVLSGFVLSHACGWNLASKMGGPTFLLKRVIRLYPLYILGSAASLAIYLAFAIAWHPWRSLPVLAISVAAAVAFIPLPPRLSYNPTFIYPLNQPAWSLLFELAANFLFALVNWTVPRLLAVAAAGAVLLAWSAHAFGFLDIGWTWDQIPYGFPRVLYSFFVGALLYRVQPKWAWRPPAPLPLLVLPLLFMLPKAWDLATVLVFFPVLVFAGSTAEPGPRLTRWFKLLGDISYPVYSLHYAVLLLLIYAYQLAGRELKDGGVTGTVIAVLITVAAGYLAGKRFDPPARRWMSGMAARLSRKAARL